MHGGNSLNPVEMMSDLATEKMLNTGFPKCFMSSIICSVPFF